jgi:hypothetical protein
MKHCLLLTIILSLFLTSCKNTKETDHSLSLDEYRQLGMPDHKHVWNMEDYSSAFFVLNTVKYENPKALPVRASERSGILFSRMISMDNLSFLQDVTLPLHAKADLIKWFVNTLMELKVAYTIPGLQDQYYIRELIDIDIFRLSVSHQMLALGQQINKSEDPSDAAMASDYPQIQQMYLNLLSELLGKHQHTTQIPLPTLELLSDSLSSSVSRNMHWFDEQASGTMRQMLNTASENSSSQTIKDNYQALLESL